MEGLIKALVFIASAVSITACDVCLGGVCYARSLLWPGDIYGQMDIDRNTNTLYFQYELSGEFYNIAYNLENDEHYVISDVEYWPSKAVDQSTGDVYFGSSRGLYKYSPSTNVSQVIPGLTHINQLFFKNKLYIGVLIYGMCTYENNNVDCLDVMNNERVEDFVVNANEDIYFRAGWYSSSNYRLVKGSVQSEFLFTHRFAYYATDKDGDVYYTMYNQVAKVDSATGGYTNLGVIPTGNVFMFAFDKYNNIVIKDISSNPVGLYKLSATGNC